MKNTITLNSFVFVFALVISIPNGAYSEDYVFETKWGSSGASSSQFNFPTGISVDGSNNVYVLDTNNHRVQKFDTNGTYITQWGSFGTGNSQFKTPFGIMVDGSNVYVADTYNSRIQKFDTNGTYITQWGSKGNGNGQFNDGPFDIAKDTGGNFYVIDPNSAPPRVQKFDTNGTYITQWGSSGSGNGQFNNPLGIALDSSNNVYVADTNNNRVQMFDTSGTYITQWGSSGSGNGQFNGPLIEIDSSNNIFIADNNNNRIQKFDSNRIYITGWGSFGTADSQFKNTHGVAIDSGDYVYVTDATNNRIQKFRKTISAPTISSIIPNNGNNNGSINITNLTGTSFSTNVGTVKLTKAGQPDITATSVSVLNSTQITCVFNLTGKYYGTWNVQVINIDTSTGTLTNGFTINDVSSPTGNPAIPTDSGVYGTSSITFNWTAGTSADAESGIVGYYLQVGTSSAGSDKFDGDVGNVLTYNVTGCVNNATYYARIRAKNGAGLYSDYSGSSAGVKITLSENSKLINNLFDPLRGGQVNIQYTIVSDTNVKITVHKSNGEIVRTLLDQAKTIGSYTDLNWDGKDDQGQVVSSGVYIVFIDAGSFKDKKRVVIAK